MQNRCWKTDNPLHIKYHDEEWGVPLHDDRGFFEFLVLGGFQAGLTWWLILQRREILRKAFDNFQPEVIANYTEKEIPRLMSVPGMIRNRAKINAAILNAKPFVRIINDYGSFDNFVWQYVGGKKVDNNFADLSDLPTETDSSRALSRALKKKGLTFVGPTICYAFMQATGIVNDHLISCFRHDQIKLMT